MASKLFHTEILRRRPLQPTVDQSRSCPVICERVLHGSVVEQKPRKEPKLSSGAVAVMIFWLRLKVRHGNFTPKILRYCTTPGGDHLENDCVCRGQGKSRIRTRTIDSQVRYRHS